MFHLNSVLISNKRDLHYSKETIKKKKVFTAFMGRKFQNQHLLKQKGLLFILRKHWIDILLILGRFSAKVQMKAQWNTPFLNT